MIIKEELSHWLNEYGVYMLCVPDVIIDGIEIPIIGDIVEIITSANSKGPNIDWLKFAKSRNARNKIRQWLKKENKSENAEKGKSLLVNYIRHKRYDPGQLLKQQRLNKVTKELKFQSVEDLFSSIGYGGTGLSRVLDILLKTFGDEEKEESTKKNDIKNF